MTKTPQWQAYLSADFESKMSQRCNALLDEVRSSHERRKQVLDDPRTVHSELFKDLTPVGYEEYAGTYRGTPETTLAGRSAFAESQLQSGQKYPFSPAAEVISRITELLAQIPDLIEQAKNETDEYGKLLALTYAFCRFGKIHPFLDGNGHVQRTMFAAMATEMGIPLSNRSAIHPRPYDVLLAIALELFARAPTGAENEQLPPVAEYLGYFLGGPFDAPRMYVPNAVPQ